MGSNNKYKLFTLSRSDRIGIAILLSIFLFLSGAIVGVKYHKLPKHRKYITVFDTITLMNLNTNRDSLSHKDNKIVASKPIKSNTYVKRTNRDDTTNSIASTPESRNINSLRFTFDPNTLCLDSLLLLGIPKYAANNLIKYREKGGYIYDSEQLYEKIYGFNNVDKKLKSYITIKPKKRKYPPTSERTKPIPKKAEIRHYSIDLNSCDTLELKKIPGIGPYFARTIIKERSSLGGFHNYQQLSDVFLMRKSLIDTIKLFSFLNTEDITKIKLNSVDEIQLRAHPYISRKQAMIIARYKEQHGPYQSLEPLLKIPTIDDEWMTKMSPYLTLD